MRTNFRILLGLASTWAFVSCMNDSQTESASTIVSSPQSITVTAPSGVSFSVTATGNPVPAYQWLRNGVAISGATSGTYSFGYTAASDNGTLFSCIATNGLGADTSASAVLTVYYSPTLYSHPTNRIVAAPATATFSVSVSGANPTPTYQWQRLSGTWISISGANATSYITPATAPADNGAQFRCVISNSVGSVTSNAVTLTVN